MSLITFEEIKRACLNDYIKYCEVLDCEVLDIELPILDEFESASNIEELVNILDNMGFNNEEAYDFIFNCIIKE